MAKKKLKIKVSKKGYNIENTGYTMIEVVGILEVLKGIIITDEEETDFEEKFKINIKLI